MSTNFILLLIIVLVVIAIISFLVKSFIKVGIILGVIYLLFHIGFLWGGQDLVNKLHLNTILKPDVSQKVVEQYNDFSQKRDANGVIQTQAINQAIDSAISESVAQAGKVDKQALIKTLTSKLQNFDASTVNTTLNNASVELAKYGITPDDIKNALMNSK